VRDGVDLITGARVAEVRQDGISYTKKGPDGKVERHDIPSNFVLWSTGIAMNPFTARVSSLLPNQVHRRAIEVDSHLRVKGAPLGDVYAIGDCATVETQLVPYLLQLVDEADQDKNGKIDFEEFEFMSKFRSIHQINFALITCISLAHQSPHPTRSATR
jgi:NADH dehydrogenase FAD-containing subunit